MTALTISLCRATVLLILMTNRDGDVAQLVERRTGTPEADSPVRQGLFLPVSAFSADSLTVPVHPPCAIACIYICAHVKDPVVHVGVRCIMETRKHLGSVDYGNT